MDKSRYHRTLIGSAVGAVVLIVLIIFYPKLIKNTNSGKTLIVYTYSSFAGRWGAGPDLIKAFEQLHGVKVNVIDVGDARMILQRIKLEGPQLAADVVVGLDQFALVEAQSLTKWKDLSHEIEAIHYDPQLPSSLTGITNFAAVDWAPLTFIYKKGEIEPPGSLQDLTESRFQGTIALMDPRTSSPGFQFAAWIDATLSPEKKIQFFEKLRPNIQSISASWSTAYGSFKKGQAKLVFSYLTSPLYHWKEEHDETFQPVDLKDPLPFQVEFVGVPDSCKSCDLAKLFVEYILSESAQRLLMDKNFMLPARDGLVAGTLFEKLPKPPLVPGYLDHTPDAAKIIQDWKAIAP